MKGAMKFVVKTRIRANSRIRAITPVSTAPLCSAHVLQAWSNKSKGMHFQWFTLCGGYLTPDFLQLQETLLHRKHLFTRGPLHSQNLGGV